ncbi:ABC transporter permease family protein [Zavarzinella formosa]|uniref:hypothetical protein n=1 Tax=Zavarzinella formosa TaxID=360055 RepID=UPI0003085366|nr:hypothetical protein [Zavarzinella formosa]
MIATPVNSLQIRLRQARRRLVTQQFLQTAGIAFGIGLAFFITWLLAEPFLNIAQPMVWRWVVLGSTGGIAIAIAVLRTFRSAPSSLETALAIDQRFDLKERLTTAFSLPPELAANPVGLALIEDARTRVERIAVRDKFPVQLGWRSLFIPAQVAAILLVWFFYDPARMTSWAKGNPNDDNAEQTAETTGPEKSALNTRPFIKPPAERPNQFKDSKELQDLQAELEKLYADNNKEKTSDKPEQLREKATEIAKAEEMLKKHEQVMAEKFQKLQQQLEGLTQLGKGEARPEGPGKEFEEALAKGDLKKAEEEADRLKKKARDKNMNEKEAEQLKKEIQQMEDRVDRLNREQKKKEEQLKDLINKAKKENRDAESLERELNNLQQEMAQTKETQKLAEAMKQAKKALEEKDFDGVADQMEKIAGQLGDLQEQLKDLDDVEEHLQNLKELKNRLCKECEGEGEGKQKGKGGEKDNAKGYAEGASGKREENKDALTKKGEENQVRGFFDPKGKKRYGGSTTGPAFKQQSSAEMAGEIQQAVQEAPEAVEVQRLPRAAKDMVKEYFEKLGGQSPKK